MHYQEKQNRFRIRQLVFLLDHNLSLLFHYPQLNLGKHFIFIFFCFAFMFLGLFYAYFAIWIGREID